MQPERARIEGVHMFLSAPHVSLFIWVLERHWNMTESSQSEITLFSSKMYKLNLDVSRTCCDFLSLVFFCLSSM